MTVTNRNAYLKAHIVPSIEKILGKTRTHKQSFHLTLDDIPKPVYLTSDQHLSAQKRMCKG